MGQVITLHYSTREPVGSKLVSMTREVPVSPATIRNIMMRLEDKGYLCQPHTSAGRLPTDLGYRAYVDDIALSPSSLSEDDRKDLDRVIDSTPAGPALLSVIAEVIARRTKQTTFHLPLRQSGVKLRHLHLERLDPHRLLVLWIGRGGRTFESVLDLNEEQLTLAMAEKAENYFNHAFRDRNLMDIQRTLTRRYGSGTGDWDLLLSKAAMLSDRLWHKAGHLDDLSFRHAARLLEEPEFQSIKAVKVLFEVVEGKGKLEKVVKRALDEEPWLLFFIGREMNDPDLESMTIALAKINHRDSCIGCVGVMGPKRMPYLASLQMLSHARSRVARLPA